MNGFLFKKIPALFILSLLIGLNCGGSSDSSDEEEDDDDPPTESECTSICSHIYDDCSLDYSLNDVTLTEAECVTDCASYSATLADCLDDVACTASAMDTCFTEDSDDDDDDPDPSTGCSEDDSDELAVGTYFFEENDGDIQYKMFRSDCTYCMETLEDDEDNADEDGEWSSEYSDEPELTITAGGLDWELSSDGLVLSQGSSSWSKDISPTVTCGGEIAD
ncbi:MAG: hypothetical protein Q7T11_01645 [Deltaproteobacteria bacterium]|nr:hypothetical protein [Deltaproteobacteria bacterium]